MAAAGDTATYLENKSFAETNAHRPPEGHSALRNDAGRRKSGTRGICEERRVPQDRRPRHAGRSGEEVDDKKVKELNLSKSSDSICGGF